MRLLAGVRDGDRFAGEGGGNGSEVPGHDAAQVEHAGRTGRRPRPTPPIRTARTDAPAPAPAPAPARRPPLVSDQHAAAAI